MYIILLGPPGSGKGTQSQLLAEQLSIPQIAPGNMLRSEMARNTALGQQVGKIVASGELVPDEIMIAVIQTRMQQQDCKSGCVLDGFPRTISQANALNEAGILIDYVFEIVVTDTEIINRLSKRFVHLASGRSYHLLHNPPQQHGLDDITGEALVQREDDQEETVGQRLRVYYHQTAPLIEYYQNLAQAKNCITQYIKINGHDSIQDIAQNIMSFLSPMR